MRTFKILVGITTAIFAGAIAVAALASGEWRMFVLFGVFALAGGMLAVTAVGDE